MKNKGAIVAILVAIVAAGAGFWGGITFAANKSSSRGQFTQNTGTGTFAGRADGAGGGRTGGMANAVFGTIISRDATSITVQLGGAGATSTNGESTGTRIVLVNDSTQVTKTVAGSTSDLTVGESVVANGNTNSDGSITAATLQLRPAGIQR